MQSMWRRGYDIRTGEEILACLAAAAEKLGRPSSISALRSRLPLSTRGVSVTAVMDLLPKAGLAGRVVDAGIADLGSLRTPALLRWGATEFVVLDKVVRGGRLKIFEPARGWITVDQETAAKRYGGQAIEIDLMSAYVAPAPRRRLTVGSLVRWSPAMTGAVVQALVFSAFLQLYVLASPLLMRVVIDDVATTGDVGLLGVVALGFGLLAIFNGLASSLRAIAAQHLQALLGWDMTRRVFTHVLALPVLWFQRRKLGDTLGRIQGLDQIRNTMANSVGIILDGVLSVTTLILLWTFAPSLAAVAGLGVGLYLAIRALAVPVIMRLNTLAVSAYADEQGRRIETLRAIQTIKLMGAERVRETNWSHSFATTLRTAQDNILAAAHFGALQSTVAGLITVLAIYLGARQVLDGSMTVGLLTAAIAYQSQFTQRATTLIEQFIQWWMMDVHLDRLDEVMLEPRELVSDAKMRSAGGALELRNVSFAYGDADPNVLVGIDLIVSPGENLVITGPSGAGKSTLLKLLCGLYPPSQGQILLDGRPLRAGGGVDLRCIIGAVMQDDDLLSGSILDNVTFFSETVDVDRAWACLRDAVIDEEISAFPAGIDTLVGDMGSAISGGQKQRVLLARALYRQPAILILDETTSHLDVPTERKIAEVLKGMKVTRIMAAHRPETIAAADRIVRLEGGHLSPEIRS